MKEIPKTYDATEYESKIYKKWESSGAFKGKHKAKGKTFSIAMPPPNATGTLHLGHAVMLAIQDIMTRYHRMKDGAALWLPGTDHASIATQNKVEQLIAKEGLTRHDLGREKFLKRTAEFVANSQNIIKNQIRSMGSSCDWSRERYTLDADLSLAVRTVFKSMYEDGLIYRGYRIVNWCPRCKSTLADDEVEYKEKKGKFYYMKYGPVIIGTARPETKFLDKVIVVHPDDKRYKKYIGKSFDIPWINGKVKATVIADKSSDPEFGTGAMTITPAHSFIDFDLAKKYGFEVIKIIDENGNLTDVTGEFAGMNACEAREKIVEKMEKHGLIDHIDENYTHNLSVCYRCGTPIEPLPSDQWFINVDKKLPKRGKSLKQMSIEAVKSKKIKILPDRFEKIYFHWMNNLHDWCISRQLWFGHQIPVWYCDCSKTPIVSIETPKNCPKCKSKKLRQDPDTLDTWFSSGLWTFSTLGWPKKTDDMKHFHPTSVMETGYDILFFWIARMIIMTLYATNEIPFKTVYLHGLIRDKFGNKMSKSKPETCIDPLDMIKKYGTDSVRLSLVIGGTPGNDMRLYEEKIAGYRNFVNKIWNASRFVLMNLESKDLKAKFTKSAVKSTADKWMVSRLQELIKDTTRLIDEFRFSEAGNNTYDFFWSVFCDWYLEISKGEHKNPAVLLYTLKTLLKLLHPFMPFVTEQIWSSLNEKQMLILEEWPKFDKSLMFKKDEELMQNVISAISEIRSARADLHINNSVKIPVTIYAGTKTAIFKEKNEIIKRMAQIGELNIEKSGKPIPSSVRIFLSGIEIYISLAGIINVQEERARIEKDIKEKQGFLNTLESRLSNKGFIAKAPKEVIEKEKAQQKAITEMLKKLNLYKNALN